MAGLHRRRAALALVATLLLAPAPFAAARDDTYPLTLDDGRTVTATLRRPDHGVSGALPAVMLFGGFQGAHRVLDKVRVDRPLVWATFDYPFEPPRKFRFPSSLKHAPEMRAAVHGTFDGVGKLYQLLRAQPDIDPARITVVGASAGAPFALVGAARHDIPGLILVQGFADVQPVLTNILARRYRTKWGEWIEVPASWLARWVLWYCEVPDIAGEAAALRARQEVLVFTATEDDLIPAPATEHLWSTIRATPAQAERIDLPGGHIGVGDDTAKIAEMLQRSLAWLGQRDLL